MALQRLTAISFSHRNTALDARDDLAFGDRDVERFVSTCRTEWLSEAAVLSTCNRTEFYLWGPTGADLWPELAPFVARLRGLDGDLMPAPAISFDAAAASHLFRVAASLESLALGENEILGQVKDVHEQILVSPKKMPVLDQLFQFAIRAGKRVRTETTLCEGAVSISSAAVSLATKIFGDFNSRKILLVGAGETAETTAMHFQSCGAKDFQVLNRSTARGQALAEQINGTYRPLDTLDDALNQIDVAVFATGSQEHLITYSAMKKVMKQRQNRPIFLIDISNPRNVDPEIAKLDSAFLYNIDDLEQVVVDNRSSRRQEIPRAEAIVDDLVTSWEQWQRNRKVTPTIASLAQFFEEIRSQELSRQHKGLSDQERQMLEDFSRGLVKKLLHNPIMYLRRSVSDNSLSPQDLDLVRSLYNLDTSPSRETNDDS